MRPHWQPFVDALETLGPDELRRRWEESQDLIRENGVTYNVYGDPRGMDRPWQLDPIPLLIAPAEWRDPRSGPGPARPAAGPDPRRPVRPADGCSTGGLLPPELVFGNPASSAPATGCRSPANRYLHLYAANLGRAADGTYRRPGRPHPGAVGRRLRAREPARPLADAARGVPRLPGPAAGPLLPGRPRLAPVDRPAQPRQSPGRAADARARTTRPTSSTPTSPATSATRWSKAATYRPRQPGLPEAAGRAAAGRRDPPPARRRLLRPAGAARRLVPGRAGLVQAVRAGNVAWPTRSAAAWSRPRRCSPTCPPSAASSWART